MYAGKGGNRAQLSGVTLLSASPEVLLAHQEWKQHGLEKPQVDGAAADVWAAGTLLYAMLTGVDPFKIEDDKQRQPEWHNFRDARTAHYSWVGRLVIMPGFGLHAGDSVGLLISQQMAAISSLCIPHTRTSHTCGSSTVNRVQRMVAPACGSHQWHH